MQYVELVAMAAVLQFLFFGFMTGRARASSGLKAPAMVGAESFERMYRVQCNTLELLVVFLPALFLAGKYWSSPVISLIGLVYVVGRFIYWRAYIRNPSTRTLGFIGSLVPIAVLCIMAVVGIVRALFV